MAPKASSAQRARQRLRSLVAAGAAAALLVVGVSTGWALDRYGGDEPAATTSVGSSPAATAATGAPATEVLTDTSYSDADTSITITTVTTGTGNDTVTYYVADVVVADAHQLSSAFAGNSYGSGATATTSTVAAANGAILAINGDYNGFRSDGIVIRNGVVYRDAGTRQGLAVRLDGTLTSYDETETSGAELVADGVWQTLSFGPALLAGGQVVAGIDDVEVDPEVPNRSIQGEQPRTGLGMIAANHFVFVVVDGRSPGYSRGVTLTEFAEIFAGLGCSVAYNLDGGGSSTMYFNGQLVNNPLGRGRERATSDILYIGQ